MLIVLISVLTAVFILCRRKNESETAVFIGDIDDIIKRYEIFGFRDINGNKKDVNWQKELAKTFFSVAASFEDEKLYNAVIDFSERIVEKQKFYVHTHIKEVQSRGNIRRFEVYIKDKPFCIDFMAVIDENKRRKIKKLKNCGVKICIVDSRRKNFVRNIAKRCAAAEKSDICITGDEIRLLEHEETVQAVKICALFAECEAEEKIKIKNALKEEYSVATLDEISVEKETAKCFFENIKGFCLLNGILCMVCLITDFLVET